ncbi:DUF2779 domain-containing protein [Rubritalea profundi]|uniref:DUF2779 domain-containing protein n=1 Tax=Rubritalea profundi TaxID=1658618 RepID=UPI0023E89E81|nr:DUF2779 domain-containing protein [Rubritalea profundi]
MTSFTSHIIREQLECFPQYETELTAIIDRLVDLLPLARAHYYHPSQQGSWSIKKVLPVICSDLNYSELEGVQDGNMAMVSFQEAIHPDCTPERKDEIYQELDKYCQLNTLAMVRI